MPALARSSETTTRSRGRGPRAVAAWAWVVGLCVAVLLATYMIFVEPPPPRRVVIAAGGKGGAYYQFAGRYAEELRRAGLELEVRETAGSLENLELLGRADSGVAVAIVQSGLGSPEQLRRFQALGSLYREPLWVFHRGGEPLARLGQLAGRRVGIGPPGSGTNAIARRLLEANGLIRAGSPGGAGGGPPPPVLVEENVAEAARALGDGSLDAGFFVAAIEADYVGKLLGDGRVGLLSFDQKEAYHRRFRFLSPVTLPAGLVDLGRGIPARDVDLVAPTAMLVVRRDFHPALVPLLLAAARRCHERGDAVSDPGEFPSARYCDFPVSEEAAHFYRSGPSVLQRLLPFWLASLADRAKVMLIPVVMLLMPLLRATPPLMRWRTRRKIYLWYSDLRDIDQRLAGGLSAAELGMELERLREIERQVAYVDVPLSYMEEFYHLRLHLAMLQEHLLKLQGRDGHPPD